MSGFEILRYVPAADLVLVFCRGRGLLASLATAVKLCRPECRLLGLEQGRVPSGNYTLMRKRTKNSCIIEDTVKYTAKA